MSLGKAGFGHCLELGNVSGLSVDADRHASTMGELSMARVCMEE